MDRHAVTLEETRLSRDELRRYGRHLIMPEVGLEGQKKLKTSGVLVVGAGGLGSPALMYLAAAGVGRIGIVDFDVVDPSNLQRQVIHSAENVGRPKHLSAKERIIDINPTIDVETYEMKLVSENALIILKDYDVIVDGSDNFPTRYLVNDACVLLGKPDVFGSIFRFEGQASVFDAKKGACYRCLYPEPPPPGLVPSCAEGGVLGVLPGIIGAIQANEAMKIILGIGDPLIGRLLLLDALKMEFRELKLRKHPGCPICGDAPTIRQLVDYETFCGYGPGYEREIHEFEISAEELNRRREKGEDILLVDVREPHEHEIVHMDGQLMPLGNLSARVHELDSSREIVTYCHYGQRSERAAALLREMGFKKVRNLAGGIDRWAEVIDPSLPRY